MDNINVLLMSSHRDSSDFYVSLAPSEGLYRLKNYLNINSIQCDVHDPELNPEMTCTYLSKVSQGSYNIIGMGITHQNMVNDLNMLMKYRDATKTSKKLSLIIAGGAEATLNYKTWLNVPDIDLIILGFGEIPLLELCLYFSKFLSDNPAATSVSSFKETSLNRIDSIAYLDNNNKLVVNHAPVLKKPLFENLFYDQCFVMDIPYNKYWRAVKKASTEKKLNFHNNRFFAENIRLYTSSHCNKKCGFCSSPAFLPEAQNQKCKTMILSAEQVHDLVLHNTDKYGAKSILFSDDDFMDPKRSMRFCELIINSKQSGRLPKDLVLNSQSRVDNFLVRQNSVWKVNYDLIKLCKKAGFYTFTLGIETFSDRLLKCPSVNKRGYKEYQIKLVLNAMLEVNLNPCINLILIIPDTTIEELVYTMKMSKEYVMKGCQLAPTSLMDILPGAPITQMPQYKYTTLSWKHDETSKEIRIEDVAIPNHPEIQKIYTQIKDVASDVRTYFLEHSLLTNDAVPKPLTGIFSFIAIARLLGMKELEDDFMKSAWKIVHREGFNKDEKNTSSPKFQI